MRWPWSADGPIEELTTPLTELDPATLEVVSLEPGDRRTTGGWAEDAAPHEVHYARGGGDPTGTAGIWRALEHS
jgi:hypothetical protein